MKQRSCVNEIMVIFFFINVLIFSNFLYSEKKLLVVFSNRSLASWVGESFVPLLPPL